MLLIVTAGLLGELENPPLKTSCLIGDILLGSMLFFLKVLSTKLLSSEFKGGFLAAGVLALLKCSVTSPVLQQQQLALLIINRGRDTALWERRSSRRVGGGVRSSCAYPVFATLCNYALHAISGLLIQSLLSVG